MSKTTKLLFTLSIVANVLLLGAAGGMAFKDYKANVVWREANNQMSSEGREMMRTSFDRMHSEMTPLFNDMRESREALKQVLAQEKFDPTQFDLAAQNYRNIRRQMAEKMSDVTKQLASNLPPEDRQTMADHLVRGFDSKGKKGSWRCDKSGPRKPGAPD
jgi:uncharacterized membrane protein